MNSLEFKPATYAICFSQAQWLSNRTLSNFYMFWWNSGSVAELPHQRCAPVIVVATAKAVLVTQFVIVPYG